MNLPAGQLSTLLAVVLPAFSLLFALNSPRAPLPPPPAPNTRLVQDMAGGQIHLRGAPQTVAVFAPMLWKYITVDGTDAHIQSMAGYMKEEAAENLLGRLFPSLPRRSEAMTANVVSAAPQSAEQVMLEAPDAVLAWAFQSQSLESIHYPGLVKMMMEESPGEEAQYRVLAQVAGRPHTADFLYDRFRQSIAGVVQDLPARTRPQGVVVMNGGNLFVWNSGQRGFNANMRMLKAYNTAENFVFRGDGSNMETLIGFDPDVVFLTVFNNVSTASDLYADPRMQSIRAVRDRRVYRMPNGAARMSGPVEEPLLLQWMAELIHPDMKPRVPLRTAIRNAYREVFGYEMSDADIDTMLRVEENGVSVNYSRFNRS